jgi:large subunit ribosomal protein L11
MAGDGLSIPVVISVYADRTFSFLTKTPPAAGLILKAARLPKGSGEPNKVKVGKLTKAQVEEIAKKKLEDLNTTDVAVVMRTIEGTCRSLGVTVVG